MAGGGAGGEGDGPGGQGHARQAAHQEVPRAGQGTAGGYIIVMTSKQTDISLVLDIAKTFFVSILF